MSTLRCIECGADNPAATRFCVSCGTDQAVVCTDCGAPGLPGASFCGECGAALGRRPSEADPPSHEQQDLPEERRRATVLFADLSGYTAIAEQLDPEVTKSLVDRALKRLSREVTDRGGHIDKLIGDNVMAVFGAPIAHEDDPERAVRAGLAMQVAMSEINAEIGARAASKGIELALRVGVNSGEVLAGAVGDRYTVIGDTVNVAARLQAEGAVGAVTVGAATLRSTAAAIEYRDLEPLKLKGKSRPIPAWEAVALVESGPSDATRRSAGPFIGRDEELALLGSLFERSVRESRPYLVTIFGQAGVGKSRLLVELAESLEKRFGQVEMLIGHSPAYGTSTTYAALGEILRERFGVSRAEPSAVGASKLAAGIEELAEGTGEPVDATRAAALIARVVGIDEQSETEDEDPEQVRDQIFAATRLVLQLLSARAPIIVAFEDVHWADEGLLDLIEHLSGWGNGPLLIVCLARDELLERRPTWGGGRRNATTLSLDPLATEEAESLVQSLLAGQPGGGELAVEVAHRSGGNPLFAEEMVNRLREERSADVEGLPDSVHAVLAARLDALGSDERRLLQAASVVGQTFWDRVVGNLVGVAVEDSLDALVNKDMIVPTPASRVAGEREFAFKHALVRDVAYGTLPRAVRARRHFELAGIIEGRLGENRSGVAALLAEHRLKAVELAEQADFPADELRSMRRASALASEAAGDVAASLYSNAEALANYENALRLGGGLDPDEIARVEESRGDTAFRAGHVDAAIEGWTLALEFQEDSGTPARAGGLHRKIAAGLWHKADRESSIAHLQRGIDLLKDGEPCRELIELYEEAASFYVETGDNMLAIYAAEKAQRLAEALGQSSTASRAHLTFGRVFGRIGDLEQAHGSFQRAVELARQASPGETVRALLALGRHLEVAEADYSAAVAACDEALELADQLGDVPAQVELHGVLGQLAIHSASWPEVDQHAEAAARLAEREGLSGQICLPLLLQGVSSWRLGDWQRAESRLNRAAEIAAAGGRSEAAFSALLWIGACKFSRADFQAACTALAEAAATCDRAGLTAQAAEATGARATVLALWGRRQEAESASESVAELLQRAANPASTAAATEARGAAAFETSRAAGELSEAIALWEEAGRPLDAIRARVLLSRSLMKDAPAAAREMAEEAAKESERVGVSHLAVAARGRVAEEAPQSRSSSD
jgi:class 3 adenylate cyclase/tetratricopeptide (TPR) repeat protein